MASFRLSPTNQSSLNRSPHSDVSLPHVKQDSPSSMQENGIRTASLKKTRSSLLFLVGIGLFACLSYQNQTIFSDSITIQRKLDLTSQPLQASNITDSLVVNNKTAVDSIQYSYGILKKDEQKHWGRHIHQPNRVLCAVPTTWNHSAHRIERIQKTWGPLCDVLVWAVSPSEYDNVNLTVGKLLVVNHTTGSKLWEKVRNMWDAIAETYVNEAEWFVKVDDDTFLFVNHLKGFTQYYNPQIPRYFGHTLFHRWKNDNIVFNAGGAYVLSREATRLLGMRLKGSPAVGAARNLCDDMNAEGEDTAVSVCLKDMSIVPDNTLDSQGRQRFVPFHLSFHKNYTRKGEEDFWYWKYKPAMVGEGKNCCVVDQEFIAAHGYKDGEFNDERFYELHQVAIASKDHVPAVPPKPSSFWYDETILDFDVLNESEWRRTS